MMVDRMAEKFHERFDIEVGIDEVKRRFVNRAFGWIFDQIFNTRRDLGFSLMNQLILELGEKPIYQSFRVYVGDDFYKTLESIENLYKIVEKNENQATHYSRFTKDDYRDIKTLIIKSIQRLFDSTEIDLGIRWEHGYFVKSGAKLLDIALVNDVLHWLRDKAYNDVLMPYEKGLHHFLEAEKRSEVLSDVITDVYEALEALAKITTRHPNSDLSANSERFIKTVKASDAYKNILKEYIDYANRFRHSPRPVRPRPSLSIPEVESFIYLTGIFIRLAINGSSGDDVT
jgi:hypothetical protein